MEKYTRKELLKQIKQRLSNGDYDEIHKYKSINTQDKIIVLGDKTLSDSEIYDYYERVEKIQIEAGLELKAMGILIDHSVFDVLDEVGRQRYLFNLSKFYLDLRKDFFDKSRNVNSLVK